MLECPTCGNDTFIRIPEFGMKDNGEFQSEEDLDQTNVRCADCLTIVKLSDNGVLMPLSRRGT